MITGERAGNRKGAWPFQVLLVTHDGSERLQRGLRGLHVDHEGGCRQLRRRRAITGGGSTGRVSNAKTQFGKISAAKEETTVIAQNGIWVDTAINRTDKTLSVSKTALSHILWS